MKVLKVDIDGPKYTVTIAPGFIGRIMGRKPIVKIFYETTSSYHYFDHMTAFLAEDGDIVSPISEFCTVLNNAKRKLLIANVN
jgi:hypothetical protein